ncbi:MAG TPA: glycosyltransferase [Candidatus Aminicenantes bacterium]|nr:glycosyltransferase [Candidatus Aminicenantes bacterium]
MERTRVLHIITEMERGGAQLFTLFTVENLDNDRFDPYLLSNPRGILNGDAQKTLRERFLTVPSLVRPLSPLDDLKALFQIRNMVRSLNPEIVHTHSSKAGILGRWAAKLSAREVKLVHTVHGFAFSPFHGRFSNTVYKTLERLTAPITDLFLFVTDEDRKEAERLGLLKRSSWAIVRSIVGVERFRQAASRRKELREKMGIPLSTPVIGGLFPFKPQKDPLGFIEIANLVHQRLPQALFLVGGDGVLRREMERLIEELGLREWVRLLGWQERAEEFLPLCDTLLLPSLWEGLPQVLVQAMACNTIPVASSVNGTKELLREGRNGLLFSPRDYREGASKVLQSLEDKTFREIFPEEAKKTLEGFNPLEMVALQERLYQKLLERR